MYSALRKKPHVERLFDFLHFHAVVASLNYFHNPLRDVISPKYNYAQCA